ncbi:hypothetical protein PG984_013564 [Apiospora sp. TS-2023a]
MPSAIGLSNPGWLSTSLIRPLGLGLGFLEGAYHTVGYAEVKRGVTISEYLDMPTVPSSTIRIEMEASCNPKCPSKTGQAS